MKIQFGYYLTLLMPKKSFYLSREDFLDRIYKPIIEKYHIKNRFGEDFIITRELSSNLFRCKQNLPQVLRSAFERADKEKELFLSGFKKTFKDVFNDAHIKDVTEQVFNFIKSNKSFTKEVINEFNIKIEHNELYEFHWSLFKILGQLNNKNNYSMIRPVGRPKKDEDILPFFYLSEEEKVKEFARLINLYSRENYIITNKQFEYFLNAIAYINNDQMDKKIKIKILETFIRSINSHSHLTDYQFIKFSFESASISNRAAKEYNDWIELLPIAYIKSGIEETKKKYIEAKETNNFYDMYDVIEEKIDDNLFLSNDYFKTEFVKNNFFMPDFSGRINQTIWSYCIYIAILCSKSNLKDEFSKYISDISINANGNRTIIDRCQTLIEKCIE